MEKAKNDEKIKHDKRRDYYSQGCAFNVIASMFLLLTLVTSYASMGVLPVPVVFYFGSMIIGAALFGFIILLASAWRDFIFSLKYTTVIIALIVVGSSFHSIFLLLVGVIGSYIFGIPYALIFRIIPVLVFPLFMIVTICVGIFFAAKLITIPRAFMKTTTYLIVLFSMVYIWGHAYRFEGHHYDEGLVVEGKTYHSIVYYGWLGDPGLVFLYECGATYFACDLIYQTSDYDQYTTTETQLVYDESARVLRLEYITILYEHPVP